MGPRSLLLTLLCFSSVAAAAILLTVKNDNPLDVRIAGTTETGTWKEIKVEFQRRNPVARFSEDDLRVQVRIAGAWQPPERFPRLDFSSLLARTNCEHVVFFVPRDAEACRFIIGYRGGGSPRCQAYGFLWRHGVSKNFPKFANTVLRCIPQQRRLRHVEIELMLPVQTPIQSTASNRLPAEQPDGSGS